MRPTEHGSSAIEFPSELEILITREFEAPMQLVFDVFTKEEHVRKTIAPFGEVVTECSIDLRVGGGYHIVFVTDDGVECSFRGRYLEIEPPTRSVQTWRFEGWPDTEAVETMEPPPWSAMTGTAYFAPRKTDRTFTAITRSQSSTDRSTAVPIRRTRSWRVVRTRRS